MLAGWPVGHAHPLGVLQVQSRLLCATAIINMYAHRHREVRERRAGGCERGESKSSNEKREREIDSAVRA